MTKPLLKVPHPRPKQFSDPFDDNRPEDLEKILNIPDHELSYDDLRSIFAGYLPVGTYKEISYFLPLALARINDKPDDSLDLLADIIITCRNHAEDLRADKIFTQIENIFDQWLIDWTNTFEVVHLDLEECKKRGFGLNHFDYVKRESLVLNIIEGLIKDPAFKHISVNFLKNLANSKNPTKKAWLIKLFQNNISSIPPEVDLLKLPETSSILGNRDIIQDAVESVRKSIVPLEKSPTYWPDTLKLISDWETNN